VGGSIRSAGMQTGGNSTTCPHAHKPAHRLPDLGAAYPRVLWMETFGKFSVASPHTPLNLQSGEFIISAVQQGKVNLIGFTERWRTLAYCRPSEDNRPPGDNNLNCQ
jgi:hypothetical protein